MNSKFNSRQFIIDFIELYKELPCLWKVSDNDYHNKIKRYNAMEKLLGLFKLEDPHATMATVSKKINSMRCAFKKELNKVKASMSAESCTGELHVPKLWYYNHFLFLEDQDTTKETQNVSSIIDNIQFKMEEESFDEWRDSSPGISPVAQDNIPQRGFKRPKSKSDKMLKKVSKQMDQLVEKQPLQPKEKHASFGEYVAEKLRDVDPLMAIYCQKIINDAMFCAETGQLNETSRIVTEQK